MARLFGAGRDPVTGEPLGRPYQASPPPADRIAAKVAQLPADLPPAVREAKVAAITATEMARDTRGAVAGFDFTFPVPNSVSVLWALSDADVQRAIVDAHHRSSPWRTSWRTSTPGSKASTTPAHALTPTTAWSVGATQSPASSWCRQQNGPQRTRPTPMPRR
jgi:hypothetical protein